MKIPNVLAARNMVFAFVNERMTQEDKFTPDQVNVISFREVLENWIATVKVDNRPELLYVVTFDSGLKQIHIGVFVKTYENVFSYQEE